MSKAKGGLGKGLSALIHSSEENERAPEPERDRPVIPVGSVSGSTLQLDITKIRPNPLQPRADFDQQALDELKKSIQQKGIIQPVTVRPVANGLYELISGERRIRASMEVGLKTVPAYIIEVRTDAEMLELALIENLQREHLNPIEIAISYQRLMSDVGLSAEQVAHKVSKDRTTVVNFLRLLKLPTSIQDALRKSQITMGHARALISLPEQTTQMKLFGQIVKKDLNVRQVEKLVRDAGKKSQKKTARPSKRAGTVEENLSDRIQQILATRVNINILEEGRGEIIIEFYSHDDLGRLFDLLASIEH
ncbi:MAG TPA: ParB/RepB/Spo0J family partition protein [Bacteroidota bacterium]|nr:ParB/RepB/Spo0J family partition protein [Bacteroidota bacterium]